MIRQFVGLLASRGLGSALQALALVLLARSVAPDAFGSVSVVVATTGFVLVATSFGLSVYVPQLRALHRDDEVLAALRLNTWSTIASAAVLVLGLAAWAVARGMPAGVVLIGVSLTLERNVDTYLGVPVADGDSRTTAVSVILRRVAALLVFGPALLLGADPVWAYTAGLLVGAVLAQIHVRRAVGGLPGDARAVPTAGLVRRSVPYLVATLSAQARTLDVSVVAAVLPRTDAGLYAAASKLVQPLLLVPQSIAATVAPRSAHLDGRAAKQLSGRLVVLFAGCLVLGSPAIYWAEPLVRLVMGPQYAGAGPALAWSLAGLPFLAMSSTLVAVLQGQGRQRIAAVNSAIFAVVLLVAVAVGAAGWGTGGAAAGLTLSYVLRVAGLVAIVAALPGGKVTDTPHSLG